MDILLIGNGFDLAHGLSTKYVDFLQFLDQIYSCNFNYNKLSPNFTRRFPNTVFTNLFNHCMIGNFLEHLDKNFWFGYFKKLLLGDTIESALAYTIQKNDSEWKVEKENWIDLECEISSVIKEFKTKEIKYYVDRINFDDSKDKLNYHMVTEKELVKILSKNLDSFIYILELYVKYVVEEQSKRTQKKSPDIEELKIDKVLSFNYTDTYKKVYGGNKDVEYCFVHGKVNENPSIDKNNMVLGIDEYLSGDERNNNLEFITFKKYYQRIYKQTDYNYINWLDKSRPLNRVIYSNLYIFGHSLDVTDKDILKKLILNPNIKTTIFYYNKEVNAQQIQNLVKVIGYDEINERTRGVNRTIFFKQQRDMINISK